MQRVVTITALALIQISGLSAVLQLMKTGENKFSISHNMLSPNDIPACNGVLQHA